MKHLPRFIEFYCLAIRHNHWRRRRIRIIRFVKRRTLFGANRRLPFRRGILRNHWPRPGRLNRRTPHILVAQQSPWPFAMPRAHPLQHRPRHQKQISGLQLRLERQTHIVLTRSHVLWRLHIHLVGTRHHHKSAIALFHILKCPDRPHGLAIPATILKIVRPGRISRLIAPHQRCSYIPGLIAQQLWLPVQPEPIAHDLIQIPHQLWMNHQIPKQIPKWGIPSQHPLTLPPFIQRLIQCLHLTSVQHARDVQIACHIKAVILLVAHRFPVHR